MDQEIGIQNDEQLTPEELAALSASDLDEATEKGDPTGSAGTETTPPLSKRAITASANLSKWRMKIQRGRKGDIELLSQIEIFQEQAKLLPPGVSCLAEELIHFAGEVTRAVNYWKESSQKIPVSDMFEHVERQRAKPYDKQIYATLYMDSGCHQVLLNAAKVPLTPELRKFVIRALERGVYWMKMHPENIDSLPEIEEGLRKLGGTPAELPSPEPKKQIRKPKPVVKPTADWIRLAIKLGHEAEVKRRQQEYDQYRIDSEEYKRAVKQRRRECKEQF